MMEINLQEDLAEALEGLDPIELLLQDPGLAEVAEEVWNYPEDNVPNGNLITSGKSIAPFSSPQWSPMSMSSKASPAHSTSSDNSCEVVVKPSKNKNKSNKATCSICGRPAKGHLFFGAVACNSCRAFFSRSIKDGAYETFECANADGEFECRIDSGSWKSCKKCRFKRCQNMGMKIPGEEKQTEGEEMTKVFTFVERTRLMLALASNLTLDEKAFLRDFTLRRVTFNIENMAKLIRKDVTLYRRSLELFYYGRNFSLKEYKTWEDFMTYVQMTAFLEGQWNLDNLAKRDRVRLVTSNFPLVNEFVEAYKIGDWRTDEGDMKKDVDVYINTMIKGMEPKERKLLKDIHAEVSSKGHLDPKNMR